MGPSFASPKSESFALKFESSKMFDVLKSRYMIGRSKPCRKASPFAASRAIFNLLNQVRVEDILRKRCFSRQPDAMYSYAKSLCSSSQQYPTSFTRLGWLSCPK
uniref:Uncharacterized protein n=1 Tax=Opuntia streptacantha TaxID=393608 RepID=A0A7C9ADC0_OPUST